MKFVRSDAPEVARASSSAKIRVSRRFPAFIYACSANAVVLLTVIAASFIVPVRAAAWFGVLAFLASNMYVFWLLKFSSSRWVMTVGADRVYVRLLMARGSEPHIIVFEASDITSMSVKTVEVFVCGPHPNIAEWLIIEPAQVISEVVPSEFISFLEDIWTHDSGNMMRVGILGGRLTIGWKWCHPDLRTFLHQIAQECPSIAISHEEHSELDLNGIWNGREKPDAQQRHMLAQAKRLGFGGECAQRLNQYKHMSLREAAAYLVSIEHEEAGAGHNLRERDDFTMEYPHP